MCGAGHTKGRSPNKPELADIVRYCADAIGNGRPLAGVQRRALSDIERCRTPALGGQLHACDACGATRMVYRSCGNRHCPKCQCVRKERWLLARQADLLPIPYFHVVFTLPHELNVLAQCEPRLVYGLLFRATAQTLEDFGRDRRHLGGRIGVTAILHTWGQNLGQHVHLHCLVTGGALSPQRNRWIRARPGFLFPVRALSKVFRGKYLEMLTLAFKQTPTRLRGDPGDLLGGLWKQPWIVYAKEPFAGPRSVLAYLGRYTHRVALTNDRILEMADGHVRFRWRDYADGNRQKEMTLEAGEFLRRFLLHVLPTGFVRIRHFGLLASRSRGRGMKTCRRLLAASAVVVAPKLSATELITRLTGLDPTLCGRCHKGRMHLVMQLAPGALPSGGSPPSPSVLVPAC